MPSVLLKERKASLQHPFLPQWCLSIKAVRRFSTKNEWYHEAKEVNQEVLDPYKQCIQGKKYFRHKSRIGLHPSFCCWWFLGFTADHHDSRGRLICLLFKSVNQFLFCYKNERLHFSSFLYLHIHCNSLWRFSMWIPIFLIDLHLNTDTSLLPLYPSSSSREWMRETFVERDESEDEGEEQRKRSIETVIKGKQERWRQEATGREEVKENEIGLWSQVEGEKFLFFVLRWKWRQKISVSQTKPLDGKSNEWLITVSSEDSKTEEEIQRPIFKQIILRKKGTNISCIHRRDLLRELTRGRIWFFFFFFPLLPLLLPLLFHPKEKRNWLKSWPEMLLRCPRIRMRHRETDSVFFSRW